MNVRDWIENEGGHSKKVPVGTTLRIQDDRIFEVHRANGYVLEGEERVEYGHGRRWIGIDLRWPEYHEAQFVNGLPDAPVEALPDLSKGAPFYLHNGLVKDLKYATGRVVRYLGYKCRHFRPEGVPLEDRRRFAALFIKEHGEPGLLVSYLEKQAFAHWVNEYIQDGE